MRRSIKKMAKAVFEVENRRRITERPKPHNVSVSTTVQNRGKSSVHRDLHYCYSSPPGSLMLPGFYEGQTPK